MDWYAIYGFAGAMEWAMDLTQFVLGADDEAATTDIGEAGETFTNALALSNYDTPEFNTYNFTVLATRLIGFDGCITAEKVAIKSGWRQSWKIMNYMYTVAKSGIHSNKAVNAAFKQLPAGLVGLVRLAADRPLRRLRIHVPLQHRHRRHCLHGAE